MKCYNFSCEEVNVDNVAEEKGINCTKKTCSNYIATEEEYYTGGFPFDDYNGWGMRHIWGIRSADDFTHTKATLHTMNDIDLTLYTHGENEGKYILGVETIYLWENDEDNQSKCSYLKELLDGFTMYCKANNINTNGTIPLFKLFNGNLNMGGPFDSIEDAYTLFKYLCLGFFAQNNYEYKEECINVLTVPPNNPLNPSPNSQLLCGKYSHYKVKGKHLAHYPDCSPENCPLLNEDLIAKFAK